MSLYHYCSNEVFFSIVDRREIWLSSLNLSNDSMEGKLLSSVILQLASDDGLQADHLRLLREQVEYLEGYFDGLGFCLSERGDLLSQWRGYAADGAGVSIGFLTATWRAWVSGIALQVLEALPRQRAGFL